jgi:RNA-directed DNA polymerase
VQAFLAEIKTFFNENLNTPVDKLLILLNPKIRGWALFHRSSASKEIFNYVDSRIFHELEHWMHRRHPRKTMLWCYDKYLTNVGTRNYVLQATFPDRRGRPRTIRLFKAADVPIKRHVKIKAAANPFLPEWEAYFEERFALQMKDSYYGYDKLLRLWFNQDGLCLQCAQKITRDTGWNLHHRVRLVDGGNDSMTNLILLHPTCHQQLHAQTNRIDSLRSCAAFSIESV